MPISFVSAASGQGTTITMPAHQAGDRLIITAHRFTDTTIPSLPSGWTSKVTNSSTYGGRVGYKTAASSSETSGTWTNATDLTVHVYRGVGSLGAAAFSVGGIPGLTLTGTGGTSWVTVSNVSGSLPALPAGCTSRATSTYGRVSDSNGAVGAWAAQASFPAMASAVELIPVETVVDADATTSWDVGGYVDADTTTAWDVYTSADSDTSTAWSIYSFVDADVTSSWRIDAFVDADVTSSWDVEAIGSWAELLASPRWDAAATRTIREVSCRVTVVDLNHRPVAVFDRQGRELGDVPVIAGEVEMTGESDQVWSARFTIADPRWVPRSSADPLHPLSPYRIAVAWRLRLTPTLWGEIPCGVYRTGKPRVSDRGTLTITVDGADVLSVAKRGGYGGRVVDVGGLTVDAALERLFATVAPTVPFRASASTVTLPAGYQLGRRKPMEDAAEIAGLDGMVVRASRDGMLTAARPAAPEQTVLRLVEGPSCPMSDLDRELADTVYNRVVVTGTHPDLTEPVYGIAEDDDDTSDTWVGQFGPYELAIDSDAVTTPEAAQSLARMHLGRYRRPAESLSATIRPRPDLDYRALVDVTRVKAGAAGQFRVSGWRMPLPIPGQPPGLMSVQFMSRQEA